jgi:diadenosine tetraphosphatase ApaH/serine/threonine PP2A family protein phosphatase
MRYAVLSDIHGNLDALTAVLEACAQAQVDRYLCLGDVVGYGAQPAECLERLEAREALIVAGNHEHGCLGKLRLDWFNAAARAALEWTQDQLGFTELDRLRRLPLTATEGPCTLAHATLSHPERFEYLVDLGQALESFRSCRTPFLLLGHTHAALLVEFDRHAQQVRRVLTSSQELARAEYRDDPQRLRYLLNPGSVGQPRDGDPRAGFGLIDTEQHSIEVRRVAYDVAEAQRKIRAAGLPGFLADRLALGR